MCAFCVIALLYIPMFLFYTKVYTYVDAWTKIII